jgi:hypothetical protein
LATNCFAATWTLVNPVNGSIYGTGSNIAGAGMTDAPAGTAFVVKVVNPVNGAIIQSDAGTSMMGYWNKTLTPPTPPGNWPKGQFWFTLEPVGSASKTVTINF